MLNILKITLASLLAIGVYKPVFAASDNECAIWLCAPSGFPSGCSGAKKAMLKRLKRFKPPLPNLTSCTSKSAPIFKELGLEEDFEKYSHEYNYAASMPEERNCRKWDRKGNSCIGGIEIIPPRMIERTSCIKHGGTDGDWSPHGCIRTYRYVKVFESGAQIGKTYYW